MARHRFIATGAFLLSAGALMVAGCGGGGGGGSSPPVNPTATPTGSHTTPTPTPTPTPGPSAVVPPAGTTYSLAGTLTKTFVRPPLTTTPLPNPNPTSSMTESANVSVNVVVNPAGTPPGGSIPTPGSGTVLDLRSSETDAYTVPPQTLTSTTDEFLQYVSTGTAGQYQIFEAGSSELLSSGVTSSTVYASGNGLVDVVPETPGKLLPANTAAMTSAESDPGGQTYSRTYAASGTYTESDVYPGNYPGAALENADGSGSLSYPLAVGVATNPNKVNTSFIVSAPVSDTINIEVIFAAGLAGSSPVTGYESVDEWYPQNFPVLWSQTFVNNGTTALPSSCAVPAGLVAPANQLVQTTTTLDTVYGELETLTITDYNAASGPLCEVMSDVVNQYYDLSGQTAAIITVASTPIQTTTLSETLGVQSASTASRTLSGARSIASWPPGIAAAHFRALVQNERVRRHTALLKQLATPVLQLRAR